ncbi:hypothetical protein AURDEDRAFT_172171 [Auricularia subglabra TFB-10046 SS5]|nr:hypothetical protein AURDEDRAFT_172171 [Auricularia subglabra TFB-10046 SS5]
MSKPTPKHPQLHNGKFRISSSPFHHPQRADHLCPELAISFPACAVQRRPPSTVSEKDNTSATAKVARESVKNGASHALGRPW